MSDPARPPSPTATSGAGPKRPAQRPSLAGVSILDMATVVAAPFAATLCGDLGAEVVKLELPDGSDPLRSLAPVKDGLPLYWKVTNRGKRGISLDVRKPRGRELLLQLLPRFDVLVENFRTGTMDRWGLDADTLFAANPRLIILRLTGYGQTGPYRHRAGFARVFEAMAGLAHLTGEADGPPQHVNFPMGDGIAGMFGALGIAAEIARLRADPAAQGAEIDLSATEAMLRFLEPLAVEYEQLGVARARNGNQATYTAPSNMYRSLDGVWFTMVASSNPIFARLMTAIGQAELATSPMFVNTSARLRNVDTLDRIIGGWFAAHDAMQIEHALEAAVVPHGRVASIAEVVEDPQVIARGSLVRLPDDDLGSIPAPAAVPRFPDRVWQVPRTGPAVGQHNAEIYGTLGLDERDLATLRADGIV